MDIKDLFRSPAQVQAVEDGRWVDKIPNLGDVQLKVRGLSSEAYKTALEEALRVVPRKKRDRDGTPFLSERKRIVTELLHKVILLDWKGISDDGKAVAYSQEIAKEWCTNPSYAQFADAVAYAAGIVDNDQELVKEEVAGN